MSNEIWLNNPTILLNQDKLGELWPTLNMSLEEKINAITRLIIILMIVGYLITLRTNIILIGIVSLISILLIYSLQKRKKESFVNNITNNQSLLNKQSLLNNSLYYELNKENYQKPTKENPLMNILIPEIKYDPKRKTAAPSFNPVVEKEINESVKEFITDNFDNDNIKEKLFGSLGDKINFDRSMIPFVTNPNTTIPNDQKTFQEFLYGNMISGKEGNKIALERNKGGCNNYTNY